MTEAETHPTLQPPGHGLPPLEAALTRYLVFPFGTAWLSWDRAGRLFEAEGRRLLDRARGLSDDQLTQRVLIRRVFGIEDSSRHWSVAMTLQHLIIVGSAIAEFLPKLLEGAPLDTVVDIAQVKPPGDTGPDVKRAFEAFQRSYLDGIAARPRDRDAGGRLAHPWFGELTAYEWHCLAAVHQRIHRRQVERIIAGLG
jgi:hypothetical protein